MTRHASWAIAWASICGTAMAAAPGYPPPGHYRIDTESVTTVKSGPATLETIQHVDGATGQVTVTQKNPYNPGPPPVQTYKGQGPNTWCVPASSPPVPMTVGNACNTRSHTTGPGGSSLSSECRSLQLDLKWKRIDERTWEISGQATPTTAANVPPESPQTSVERSMAMTMPHLTPEQQAQARAMMKSMPSSAQMAAAQKPAVEGLKELSHNGSPQEAAMAKQRLQAMQGQASGAPPSVTRWKEKWTRIADNCPGKP